MASTIFPASRRTLFQTVAIEHDGEHKPLLFSGEDTMAAVVIPLDHRRLLVGRKSPETAFNPYLFNIHAISCAETFFVSSERTANLEEWSKYIRVVSQSTMFATLKDVFSEYSAPALPQKVDPDGSLNLTLNFKGATNESAVREAGEKMKELLGWAAQRISLDRTDRIIFSDDVATAAAHIERGFEEEAPNLAAILQAQLPAA